MNNKFNISLQDLDNLIAEAITKESLKFTLHCNLEDPSSEEVDGFYTGSNSTLWLLRKAIDPSSDR